MTHMTPVMLILLLVIVQVSAAAERIQQTTVHIRHGELSVLFRDNSKSPGLLSGIDSLRNVRRAPNYDAFDPDNPGASAGLNFEHIISGHRNVNNKFTPRHGRYSLYKLPDGKSAQLVRRAEDSPWNVASTLRYTVKEPYYIDFQFRCTPRDASRFGTRGYAIFFFANYMNDVADTSLNFLGTKSVQSREEWIAADAPRQHPHWNGGGNYHSLSAPDLKYDDDVLFRLNTWSYDWPRFTKPFYYGRAGHDMTLILMFDRVATAVDEIRFSLYKFKLNQYPRPAWDFQYVIRKVETGRPYGFRGRMAWKKFVSEGDCLNEYTRWANSLKNDGDTD